MLTHCSTQEDSTERCRLPDFPDKAELRSRLIAARRARAAAPAPGVRAELLALVRALAPSTVTAYVPLPGEPGEPWLPDALLPTVGRVLLPVLRPDLDLDWAVYQGPSSLAPAARGLREPTGPRLGAGAIGSATLVIVPALAVDRAGRRLGRGGGSYDRALTRLDPAAVTVALLHDGELLDAVPAEPHDRPVRAVITPTAGLQWVGSPPIVT
jgi:5-formyltetrahydrofolate cyclo-ligase